MGDDLVAHCDNLGKLGLVDYQMGVSEEEIIDSKLMPCGAALKKPAGIDIPVVLNRCIDLIRTSDDNEDGQDGGTTTNQPPPRRNNR